jgi:hypothetical protein
MSDEAVFSLGVFLAHSLCSGILGHHRRFG